VRFPVGSKVWIVDAYSDLPSIKTGRVLHEACRSHRVSGAVVARDDGFSELANSANVFTSERAAVTEAIRRLTAISEQKHKEWSAVVVATDEMKIRLGKLKGPKANPVDK
jgi:hypothetical protein